MVKFYDERPQDHCGIFGVFAPSEDVARLTFFGLMALQHRGQESTGIAVSDYKDISCTKGMGLVSQFFTEDKIKDLKGKIAIGHTRYSTEGSTNLKNAQPILLSSFSGDFALAHNGNIFNYEELKKFLYKKGHCLDSTVDSEIISRVIAETKGKDFKEKLIKGIPKLKGAFSMVFLLKDKLYVVRDPWGIRPLVLGKINSSGWVVSSESTAIETIGGEVIREVKPGEFIEISSEGIKSFHQINKKKGGFCIFEYIYFARPDSVINDRLVQSTRLNAGKILAMESPADADYVISVPDSGTSSALGFSQQSGIPFQEGLIKNRFIGRTFIQPNQRIRDLGVQLKFNPLGAVLKGKRVVLVDDSLVRGTTLSQIIKMLRNVGVKEIHLRIASPPFKNICFLGIDVNQSKELIAQDKSVDEICDEVKADSLSYISLLGIKKAVGKVDYGLCTGCFDGKYPVKPSRK